MPFFYFILKNNRGQSKEESEDRDFRKNYPFQNGGRRKIDKIFDGIISRKYYNPSKEGRYPKRMNRNVYELLEPKPGPSPRDPNLCLVKIVTSKEKRSSHTDFGADETRKRARQETLDPEKDEEDSFSKALQELRTEHDAAVEVIIELRLRLESLENHFAAQQYLHSPSQHLAQTFPQPQPQSVDPRLSDLQNKIFNFLRTRRIGEFVAAGTIGLFCGENGQVILGACHELSDFYNLVERDGETGNNWRLRS